MAEDFFIVPELWKYNYKGLNLSTPGKRAYHQSGYLEPPPRTLPTYNPCLVSFLGLICSGKPNPYVSA